MNKNTPSRLLTPLLALGGLAAALTIPSEVDAQRLLHRVDSMLTVNYRKGDVDTAYIMRPTTKLVVSCWRHRPKDSTPHSTGNRRCN